MMIGEDIEIWANRKRMRLEREKKIALVDLQRAHTHISGIISLFSHTISLFLSLSPRHRRHLMVVSCRKHEESATEFPPLSQIPASLASSSSSSLERKKRLDDGRRDKRSRTSGSFSLANRYSDLKHRRCKDIPRFEVWIESDAPARWIPHSGFCICNLSPGRNVSQHMDQRKLNKNLNFRLAIILIYHFQRKFVYASFFYTAGLL